MRWSRAFLTWLVVAPVACGDGRSVEPNALSGHVTDTAQESVAGATVFAIPAELVAWAPLLARDISAAATLDYDEPLENLIEAQGGSFPRAVTAADGAYTLSLPAGRYFLYVAPDAQRDPLHLPGGSASRQSRSADELLAAQPLHLTISSKPSSFEAKDYIGTEACLGCHTTKESWKKHAHANGIHQPGKASPLQNQERLSLADAPMLAKFTADTTLYYYDYDSTRGDDKFKVQEGGPAPLTAEFSYRLFMESGQLKVELQNLVNAAADSLSGARFVVDFFYGGLLMKQRMITRLNLGVSPATQTNHYWIFPPVTIQPGGTTAPPLGRDRTRWLWKDERGANFWDASTKRFTVPPLKETFDAQCAACHFTGFSIDPKTLEATAFETPSGIPWKTPERRVEGNLACEVCHGPGREHRAAALSGRAGQFIVHPGMLAAEREMFLCGQCHSRPVGNDSLGIVDQPPLNPENRMAPPGTRRSRWRAQYTTRPDGDPLKDFWDDGIHSRKNRQQFSDLVKSKKYRNPRILVACTDCHDIHGGQTDPLANPRGLVAPIDDNSLCLKCHDLGGDGPGAANHKLHTLAASFRPEAPFRCVNCHMDLVAKTSAGKLRASDATHLYFENDIRDHSFVIPRRDNPGVANYTLDDASKGKAMPIPYTRACGECHRLDSIAAKH